MNKRQEQYENWFNSMSYELETEFINNLAIEDQPKTDDTDEIEQILMNKEEEFIKYCQEEYDRGFNNEK